MRTRPFWPMVALALVVALVALPAAATEPRDSKFDEVMAERAEDFAQAVASEAPERSNAPRSFAPCIRGMAAGMFPCDGVDMLSWVDQSALGTTFVNDIWGWTDPQTGKDYAVIGATEGTVFVDISDPRRPAVLGILPAHALDPDRPFWRDIKVHADHAYVVSEQVGHGMQVFDLTELRDWDGTYTTYSETAHYDGIDTAHNVAINTDSAFAYVVGARNPDRSFNCGGGLHMVDISDPAAPEFAGCFEDHGYVHDTQCVIYEGPDAAFQGREICFNSSHDMATFEQFVGIVDVTDKSDPTSLALSTYPNSAFSHQAWLTPDQQYLLHGDELDELFHGIGTTTRIWDVRSLADLELIGVFENDTPSIDHNLYTQGRYVYASNYTSGLRVYDARHVADGELSEVAYFDVYPENDNPSFEGGTWSNYPYFRQKGVVAAGSMDRGLFILQPRLSRAGG
jgi:choice-of-anchor B domain-containing protein